MFSISYYQKLQFFVFIIVIINVVYGGISQVYDQGYQTFILGNFKCSSCDVNVYYRPSISGDPITSFFTGIPNNDGLLTLQLRYFDTPIDTDVMVELQVTSYMHYYYSIPTNSPPTNPPTYPPTYPPTNRSTDSPTNQSSDIANSPNKNINEAAFTTFTVVFLIGTLTLFVTSFRQYSQLKDIKLLKPKVDTYENDDDEDDDDIRDENDKFNRSSEWLSRMKNKNDNDAFELDIGTFNNNNHQKLTSKQPHLLDINDNFNGKTSQIDKSNELLGVGDMFSVPVPPPSQGIFNVNNHLM